MAERAAGPTGFIALARPPDARQRRALRAELERLLAWQRALRRWPTPRAGLAATPFVSLYARGRMFGCFGSLEGPPAERLARAFLRALEDMRFGGLHAEARGDLAAQASYPLRVVAVPRAEAFASPRDFELGTHGVALALADGRSSIVLPFVARESRLDARGLIDLALRKAGAEPDEKTARSWLFETCDVATGRDRDDPGEEDRLAAAAAWLAGLVGDDGAVAFAIDPRSGARFGVGDVMHHGRAAVVIAALARRGEHAALVRRARARLERDVRAALAGKSIAGWPAEPAIVAGTLALARLAGARVDAELEAFARAHRAALIKVAWHAAQVVCALGVRADAGLIKACARDLERSPWAPWTVLAARACGDAELLARAEPTLVASIRADAPHRGGAGVTPVPEIALTAIVVEALAPSRAPAARRAVARGQAFLRSWQLVGERLGAAYDLAAARGAFPISPAFDALRCDVTAHALLALT
jgi:AMMECR1 domain-containing protein